MTKFPPASKKRWGFRIAELHSRAKGSAEAHKLATWPEISSHYQSRCASLAGRGALFLRCYNTGLPHWSTLLPCFCPLDFGRSQGPISVGGRRSGSQQRRHQTPKTRGHVKCKWDRANGGGPPRMSRPPTKTASAVLRAAPSRWRMR